MLTNNRLFFAIFFSTVTLFASASAQTIVPTAEFATTDKYEVTVFVQATPSAAGLTATKLLFLREDEVVKKVPMTGNTVFVRLPLKQGVNDFSILISDNNNKFTSHTAPLTITCNAAGPAPAPAPATNAVDLGLKKVPVTNDRTHPVEISPQNLPANANNYVVEVNGDPATRVFRAVTQIGGKLRRESIPVSLKDGKNKILVTVVDAAGAAIPGISDATEVEYKDSDTTSTVNSRAIVGIQQIGASSSDSRTIPFIDFFVNVPFGKKDPRPLSFWVNPRFSATSVQSFSSLTNLSAAAVAPIFGTEKKINNILQSFSINTGLDYRIKNFNDIKPFFIPMKPSLSFIIGGGVTTPLSSKETAEEFKIPTLADGTTIDPKFQDLFRDKEGKIITDLTGKKNIALVKAERDRFLRNWFVGARIQTNFVDSNGKDLNLAPGMFDIKFGQDEAITQTLRGNVLGMEGFMPFPIGSTYVYFFGGINIRLTRRVNNTVPPFFLESVPTPSLSNADTVIVNVDNSPFNNSKRDTYRFGIGIDLLHLKRPDEPKP